MARWEVAALLGLLVLAAVARMARPGLTEFKADEGRLLSLALATSQGDIARHGIASSVGFPNAPLSVWLYALPLTLWRHPYAPTLFLGLLNTLAVAGVYWLARRTWGAPAAVAAALLFAAGPWAILFSRKLWAQNLLPLFAVGWGMGALLAFVEGRRPFVALHLVCLAILAQLHPAALGLAPATLMLLLVFRRRVGWWWAALGGLLGALTAAPFLWYLWQRQATGGLPLSTGQTAASLSVDSVRLALAAVAGAGIEPLAGPAFAAPPGAAVARWLWVALVVAGAVVAGVMAARHWARPAAQVGLIALVWFVAPVLLFVWQWTPVYVHYFIAGLPAGCLLAGLAFGQLVDRAARPWRAAAWAALALSVLLQLATWGGLMRAVAADPAAGGFGIPLGAKLAAADAARDLMGQTGAAEVLLVGDGADPEIDDFPAEFRALLHDLPLRYVDLNAEALFPAAATVALLDVPTADGPTSVRDLYAAVAPPQVVSATPNLAYTVHALASSAAPPPDVALPPALWANFARLTGYNRLRPGPAGALWDVVWQTADNPDPADYHIYNHLLDATGARVAQADGAAFPGAQWRAGDVVISRFLLPTVEATPPLTMRVGMYRFPSLEAVPVLDEAANSVADAIEIPLE